MMAASPERMRRRRTSGAAITAHCPPFSLYSGSPSALRVAPQRPRQALLQPIIGFI